MREFANKKEYIYENEEYYEAEEKVVNSEEIINEEDYLDFSKLKFFEKKHVKKQFDIKDYLYDVSLDKEKLIEEFIDNFLKTFPGIYTKKQLEKKLNNNLLNVYEDTNEDSDTKALGSYQQKSRTIRFSPNPTDNTKFHEFIHAIRGNEIYYNITCGITEGLTTYAECIYDSSSKINFSKPYDYKNCVLDYDDKTSWLYGYKPLLLIIQELEILNECIQNEETLLMSFLKGENVYVKIKDIYVKYYESISKENNTKKIEEKSQKATFDLMTNMSYIRKLTCSDFGVDENEVIDEIEKIEKELVKMFYAINNDKALNYKLDKITITQNVETPESWFLKCLFGEEKEPKIYNLRKMVKKR